MSIGTTVKRSCTIDLSKFLSSTEAPSNSNMFYEMYLEDYNGDLIDVPVKINNFINEFGDEPNRLPTIEDWELTRRFFVLDTKSGISNPGGFDSGSNPEIVRYAKNITLKVELDTKVDQNEMIYPPHLEIEYEEKKTQDILSDVASAKLAEVSFVSENYMETAGFWSLCSTLFTVLMIVLFLIIFLKICIMAKSDRLDVDATAQVYS
jgi:hypothetical protein